MQNCPISIVCRKRRGLTLVEVMFSIVVMSTMLVASLGAVGAAARGRTAQKESAKGLALARLLLTEITQTRYQDLQNPVFGVEAGEARATFDDVDDYDGWQEASARYADGTAVVGAAGWRRAVTVQWLDPYDFTKPVTKDCGLKRITVTVTSPTGRVTRLSAFRSGGAGYETVPGSQVTYTCWVGMSIQVGREPASRSTQGAATLNLVP